MEYKINNGTVKIFAKDKKQTVNFVNSYIVNIYEDDGKEREPSYAVSENLHVFNDFEAKFDNNFLFLSTDKLTLKIDEDLKISLYDKDGFLLCEDYDGERKPFIRRGDGDFNSGEGHKLERDQEKHKVEVLKRMFGNEYFYGLGETTGHINKKGYSYIGWNSDNPSPHTENFKSLYKDIPFFITLREGKAFGIFFDNTYRSYFDFGKENSSYYYFGADGGHKNYYFIVGPEIKDVIENYSYLTGRTPLPPMWALGYHQSRWSYSPDKRANEVAEKFREEKIPCDVIHLDINYMDGYRVFTWGLNKFKSPKEFVKKLKHNGFKLTTIIDPGVKKDEDYFMYKEGVEKNYFALNKDGSIYENKVWPGDAVFPNFLRTDVRSWWSEKHKLLADTGVLGVWDDMNEPASFEGQIPEDVVFKDDNGKTKFHSEIHNIYGLLMAKSTYEGMKKASDKRPFVLTRACYAGAQKYTAVWTGDNHSIWNHLKMSIPMLLNLGMSGMAFCGTDVGGFQFDCTPELLMRWVQVGCFTPFFRNHSCIYTRDQEPWTFDEKTEEVYRRYVELRYKLLPYIYNLMKEAENKGYPALRPLFMHYQDDEETYEINDEFLFGEEILVAPVVIQGAKKRMVYLPGGKWIDYWTEKEYEGKNYYIINAPIDICPMFVKSGSIIPGYPPMQYVGEKKIEEITLDIYKGNGNYSYYEDNGEDFKYKDGEYNLYEFEMKEDSAKVIISFKNIHRGYGDGAKTFKFIVHNVNAKSIAVDGETHFVSIGNDLIFNLSAKDEALVRIIKG